MNSGWEQAFEVSKTKQATYDHQLAVFRELEEYNIGVFEKLEKASKGLRLHIEEAASEIETSSLVMHKDVEDDNMADEGYEGDYQDQEGGDEQSKEHRSESEEP